MDFEVRRRGSTSRFEARGRGSRQPSRRALPPSSYPPGGLPRPENHPPRPSNLSPYLTSRPLHRRAAADRGKMMGSGSKRKRAVRDVRRDHNFTSIDPHGNSSKGGAGYLPRERERATKLYKGGERDREKLLNTPKCGGEMIKDALRGGSYFRCLVVRTHFLLLLLLPSACAMKTTTTTKERW